MLFANKQALETDLKVSLLSIRERELGLYAENCRNIGSISCMLAGFAYCTLTFERSDTFSQGAAADRPVARYMYELLSFFGLLSNMASMFGATTCSMLGPGLALRGSDGSMDQAVEGLALEYRMIFMLFLCGVVSYYACFSVFLVLDYDEGWLDAFLHLILVLCFLIFLRSTAKACKRIYKKFHLPPEHAIAGSFDAAARGPSQEAMELERLTQDKKWYQWPYRQWLYANVFVNEFVGISHAMFEQRYKSRVTATGGSTRGQRRAPNNETLHRIIRYLEKPTGRTGASSTIAEMGLAPSPSAGYDGVASQEEPLPTVGSRRHGGGGRWLGFGKGRRRYIGSGEEVMALPASVENEVELSDMAELSPSRVFDTGAVSHSDSEQSSCATAPL